MKYEFSIFLNSNKQNVTNYTKTKKTEATQKEIFDYIQNEVWSPTIFNEDYRDNDNFQSSSILGIDIDADLPYMVAVEKLNSLNLNYILCFTRHHQKPKGNKGPCDRYRIILFLKEKITKNSKVIKTLELIKKKIFPELDKQCIDSARLFYPCTSSANKDEAIIVENREDLDPEVHLKETVLETYLNIQYLPEKIRYFLNNSNEVAARNEWNDNLNRAVFYLATIGKKEDDIYDLIESIAPQPLDKQDIAVIKSAFSSGEKNKIIDSEKPKKVQFQQNFNLLSIELDKIHLLQTKEGTLNILYEEKNKEVKYVNESFLKRQVSQVLVKHQLYNNESDTKNLTGYFLDHKEPLKTPPSLISFHDSDELSIRKIDFTPTQGYCPHFIELLSRSSNAEALAAYTWSIFEPKSDQQQYLWGFGHGQDGKGAFGRLLAKLLGDTYCSEISSKNEDKHFASNYLDKRLIHYPDNNDPNLTTTSTFKMLTGGDSIKVNPKYKETFTVKLNLKVLIFSNNEPKISTQKSDQRRIIYCEFKPFEGIPNPNYENELWEERAAILYYCKSIYEKIVRNHGPIPVDNNVNITLGEKSEESKDFIFSELFVLDQSSYVTQNEFHGASFELCKRHNIQFIDFKNWVLRTYSLKIQKVKSESKRDTNRIEGIRLINHPFHPNSINSLKRGNDEI